MTPQTSPQVPTLQPANPANGQAPLPNASPSPKPSRLPQAQEARRFPQGSERRIEDQVDLEDARVLDFEARFQQTSPRGARVLQRELDFDFLFHF